MQIRQEIHNGFIFYLPGVCTTAENKKKVDSKIMI